MSVFSNPYHGFGAWQSQIEAFFEQYPGGLNDPNIGNYQSPVTVGLEEYYPEYSGGGGSSISYGSMPNIGSILSNLTANSPTYAFDTAKMTADPNRCVPIIYGTIQTSGNVISLHNWFDGEKNYLNLLILICEGEIEDITDIRVNKIPIANFDGVTSAERYGTNNQTVIPNWNDQFTTYSLALLIAKGTTYEYTSGGSNIEGFEINLGCLSGLYQTDERNGELLAYSISVTVQYSVHGAGSWTTVNRTETRKTGSATRFKIRVDGLSANQYDIKVTNNNSTESDYIRDDLTIISVEEFITDDIAYVNSALLGLGLLGQEQLSGNPNVTFTIKGLKVSSPKILTGIGGDQVDWEDYYYDSVNSKWKLFSDDSELYWDGTTYVNQYCANPIWCMKDLLTNSRYGIGEYIDSTNIDDDIYLEMAKYCEEKLDDGDGGYEKRFYLDVNIDSFTRALDLIKQLCATFDALSFYSGDKVQIVIDKARTATKLFGMGNIIKNSFNLGWKSVKEIQNVTQVIYNDKDKNYEEDSIFYPDLTAQANGDPENLKSFRVFTTRESQAIRKARKIQNIATYIDRTVSFRAATDGHLCRIGDRIEVCHDVPAWGYSGRVSEKILICVGVNDKLDWTENGSTYACTLNPAKYTPAGIAAEIQRKMRAQGDANTTVTHDTGGTNKITIANATLTTLTLLWDSGANASTSCGVAIGFDVSADDTGALTYTADNAITETNTTTKIKLDRPIVIAAGTYKISVQFSGDDSIEERTITESAGTYTAITVSVAFSSAPASYDLFHLGVDGAYQKPFQITWLSKEVGGEVDIRAIEYNASVYDDTAPSLPTNNYSSLNTDVPYVEDLTLKEWIVKLADGTIESRIGVYFNIPDLSDYYINQWGKAKIYVSIDSGTSWEYRGETSTNYYEVHDGLKDQNDYTIVVTSVSKTTGIETTITNSPQETIYLLGKSKPPEDVVGFVAIQDGNDLVFSWSGNVDVDLKAYEIREGSSWDTAYMIATDIKGTDYRLTTPAFGTKTYLIKAIDTSDNYSNNAASSSVTIDSTPDVDNIGDFDLDTWSEGSYELGTQIENVYDSNDDQVIDSGSNLVVTYIYGFGEGSEASDENVVDSVGDQVATSENEPVIQSQVLSEFLQLREIGSGVYADEGIYISKTNDLGAKYKARINVVETHSGEDCYYEMYIRTSDDGTTWSDWSTWGFGEYECRYFQIKFVLGTYDNTKWARLHSLKARVTVQYYREVYEDQSYSGSGTNTKNFNNSYFVKAIALISEQGNYYAEITAKDLTSVTYRLRDNSTDALTTGTVDIEIIGY